MHADDPDSVLTDFDIGLYHPVLGEKHRIPTCQDRVFGNQYQPPIALSILALVKVSRVLIAFRSEPVTCIEYSTVLLIILGHAKHISLTFSNPFFHLTDVFADLFRSLPMQI